jgi:dCTP deaminase
MTILNDIQIRRYCVTPEYWYYDSQGWQWPISPPYTPFENLLINFYLSTNNADGIVTRNNEPRVVKVTHHEKEKWKPMIEPFVGESISEIRDKKVISFGLSSFGYDFRIAPEFKVFTNIHSGVIDPKNFNHDNYVTFETDVLIAPPTSFILSRTLEKFNMPTDVVGIVVGKSTIARTGIQTFGTPAEPGWSGYLTLEYANLTNLPAKLYANEGGLQVNFYRGSRPETIYSDRKGRGKYQDQPAEVVFPRV